MNEQGKERPPEALVFTEYVQREQANEGDEEEAQNPGCPKQAAFGRCFHNFSSSRARCYGAQLNCPTTSISAARGNCGTIR
jgi:hypothetical protein